MLRAIWFHDVLFGLLVVAWIALGVQNLRRRRLGLRGRRNSAPIVAMAVLLIVGVSVAILFPTTT